MELHDPATPNHLNFNHVIYFQALSVQDAASHSLAWLGSAIGVPQVALGVDRFGESGTIGELHEITGISTGDIVNAALIAAHEMETR